MVLSSSAVVVSNFKVSMAQETVEGGNRILGGKRWLFTLHSDQSFLNTPELRGSRIGTHPQSGPLLASVSEASSLSGRYQPRLHSAFAPGQC